ncbi:hypothetical protein KJ742_02690 [Patescibacteria group bacterium]|nr:hypothetical protein [Patescibacteria group bacterium]MBU1682828.1 hypothetical protein [Patescibacteria group bacterium]MBU1935444.1 hypothetical protein [Patescibacteria group bacterium]
MIPISFDSSDLKNKEALVKELQNNMCAHFLEHTMYDINDALTSILALCDVEEMRTIPRVKKYISRVNQLLNDVKTYQSNEGLNINHVIENVIDIVEDNFKGRTKITCSCPEINALVKCKQSRLERILLYVFVELITGDRKDPVSPISVDLRQKGKDVTLTINKPDFSFSTLALKEMEEMRSDFGGVLTINFRDGGVEIVFKMPLQFQTPQSRIDLKVQSTKKQEEKRVYAMQ